MLRAVTLCLLTSLGPPPPPSPATPTPSEQTPIVSDAVWQSVVGKRVVVDAYDQGPIYIGTIQQVGEQSVIMVYDDGQLIEIEKHEVDSVKLDMNEPAASEPTADPAPVAATPVAATTSAGGCTGDTQCSYPRKCVEGICKAPEQYLVALKAESEQRLNAGKWTMVAGAGVAAVGLVIMAVGFGHAAVLRKERDSRNCGFSTDQTGCNELRDKISDYEFAGWLSLYAVIPAAAIVVMAGGITYAVGKNKQRRWEQNRHVQMTPWFGPREVGMTLRF